MPNKETRFDWDDGSNVLPWFHRMMEDFPKQYPLFFSPSVDFVYDTDEINSWREKWLGQFKEDS